MKSGQWIIRSRKVVTPSGTRAADVVIRRELIAEILAYDDLESEGVILDVGDLAVLPGLVALHMGGPQEADWRGFEAATRDAASGGVTTLVDLPADHDPASGSPDSLRMRLTAAQGKLRVDCGLVVGLGHGNASMIESWIESGVIGVEAHLGNAGPGSPRSSTEKDLRAAMPILARLGRPLLVHSDRSGKTRSALEDSGSGSFGSALPDREFDALRLLIRLCRESRCGVHLIHPTASEALPMIAEARAQGLPITVETCPNHLNFPFEEVANGLPTLNLHPVHQGPDVRERLWDGLRTRLIDGIGADHPGSFAIPKDAGPAESRLARRDYTSLRLALPSAWTEAKRRGFALDELARWMATRPARAFGLAHRKGSIQPGLDADLVVFDPNAPIIADPDPLHHRHDAPPIDGRSLLGKVEATILRGTLIHNDGHFHEVPTGSVVLRLEETLPLNITRN